MDENNEIKEFPEDLQMFANGIADMLPENMSVYMKTLFAISFKIQTDFNQQINEFFIKNAQKICSDNNKMYIGKRLKDGNVIFIVRENKVSKKPSIKEDSLLYVLVGDKVVARSFDSIYKKNEIHHESILQNSTEFIKFSKEEYIEKVQEAIDLQLNSEEKNERWIWVMMRQCNYYIENGKVEEIEKVKRVEEYIKGFENKKYNAKIKRLEKGIKKLRAKRAETDKKEKQVSNKKTEEQDIKEELKKKSFITPKPNNLKKLIKYCTKYNMLDILTMSIFNYMLSHDKYEDYLEEILLYFEMYENGEIELHMLQNEIEKNVLNPKENTNIVIKDNNENKEDNDDNESKNQNRNKSQEKEVDTKFNNETKSTRKYPIELSALNRMKFILDNFEIEEILIGKYQNVKGRIFFKVKDEEYIIAETFFKEYRNNGVTESYGNATWLIPTDNVKYEEEKVVIEKDGIKRVNHGKNAYYRNLILKTRILFKNENKKLNKKYELVKSNIEKIKNIEKINKLIEALKKMINPDEITAINNEIKKQERGD